MGIEPVADDDVSFARIFCDKLPDCIAEIFLITCVIQVWCMNAAIGNAQKCDKACGSMADILKFMQCRAARTYRFICIFTFQSLNPVISSVEYTSVPHSASWVDSM